MDDKGNSRGKLRLRDDGTFSIVQFTDLHWQNGEKDDLLTRRLMARTLEAERPDLVVLTGDILFGSKCKDPARSLRQAVEVVESAGVPWAATFGNHDDEGSLTRAELLSVIAEHPRAIAETGPTEIAGIGNYVATVTDKASDRPLYALYFLDSGAYSHIPSIRGYDWIRGSQIDWYRAQAEALAAANGGSPLPSLSFFHIPLPEYELVWRTQACFGHRYEKQAIPAINSGLFSAMLEAGGMLGTFCGHDHINDYWGELGGIRLCYGRASGYQTYGRKRFQRGARIIKLRQGEPGFVTWIRLADGQAVVHPKVHRP